MMTHNDFENTDCLREIPSGGEREAWFSYSFSHYFQHPWRCVLSPRLMRARLRRCAEWDLPERHSASLLKAGPESCAVRVLSVLLNVIAVLPNRPGGLAGNDRYCCPLGSPTPRDLGTADRWSGGVDHALGSMAEGEPVGSRAGMIDAHEQALGGRTRPVG
jgi:hypothetical protein